jgi:integrase
MLSDFPELDKRQKQIYSLWIMGYLRYADANELGEPSPSHINRFLDRLSEKKGIDDSMRQQAAEALVFFHECVLGQNVSEVHGRLSMLSREERQRILSQLSGPEKLLARIVFHTELDLTEALRLRVGDVNLNRGQITVSNAQGVSDRFVNLSSELSVAMERHLQRVHDMHERDLEEGHGVVDLPASIRDQFPGAGSAWMWQYVFPSPRRTVDLHSGRERRYPMQPKNLLDAIEMLTEPRTRHFISSMSRGKPNLSNVRSGPPKANAPAPEPPASQSTTPESSTPESSTPEPSTPESPTPESPTPESPAADAASSGSQPDAKGDEIGRAHV